MDSKFLLQKKTCFRSLKKKTCFFLYLSEEEALQVLADLHGEGDKTNDLVVLEYEEIKQQVIFLILPVQPKG